MGDERAAGVVAATFTKPRRGGPVVPAARLELVGGVGIAGDANAGTESPRQVLLVTQEVEAGLGLDAGALWENVTTAGIDVDRLPSGTLLQLGLDAVVGLTYDCRPCRVITDATGASMRQLVRRRGMVAVVMRGGGVVAGDAVRVLPERLGPLPDTYLDRLRLVVGRIPPGTVLTHDDLVVAMGAPGSVRRILPQWLSRLGDEGLPAHRAVARTGAELGPLQERRLVDEGVSVREGRLVDLPGRWSAQEFLRTAVAPSRSGGPVATDGGIGVQE